MSRLDDRATERELLFRDVALGEQQRRARQSLGAESAEFCQADHCGEPIPEARRRAIPGVQFCVECQALRERRQPRSEACE